MSAKGKLLIVAALVIAVGSALAIGVPASTIFFAGISLLCPGAMFFAMHSGGACHRDQERGQSEKHLPEFQGGSQK